MFTSHTSKSFILTWPGTSDGMLTFKNRLDGMLTFKNRSDGMLKIKNKITNFKILHIRFVSFHIRTWPTHSTAKKNDSMVKILTAVELHQCPQSLQRISAVPLSSTLNPVTRPCHGYDMCNNLQYVIHIILYPTTSEILSCQTTVTTQHSCHESGHHGLQWI